MNTEIDLGYFPPPPSPGTPTPTLRELASMVDEHSAALWRGDEDIDSDFFRWFASCLCFGTVAEPTGPAVARSVLAAGGFGIRWYETPTEFTGFIPGRSNARYVIPKSEIPSFLARIKK
jgi:hypothetical protein